LASAFKQTPCRLGEMKLLSTVKICPMIVCECIYRRAQRSHTFTGKTRICVCGYGTCTMRVLIRIVTLMD